MPFPKKDEPCFTRYNKAGAKYITCKGTQNKAGRKASVAKRKARGDAPPARRKAPARKPTSLAQLKKERPSSSMAEARARKFINSFPKSVRDRPDFQSIVLREAKKLMKK